MAEALAEAAPSEAGVEAVATEVAEARSLPLARVAAETVARQAPTAVPTAVAGCSRRWAQAAAVAAA